MESKNIKIERNAIENALIAVKEFILLHRKGVLLAFGALLVVIAAVIGFSLYYDYSVNKDLLSYEAAMEEYALSMNDVAKKENAADKFANSIESVVKSSSFGYVHENGYFVIAGIYYSEKKYEKARDFYKKYYEMNKSEFFAPMALQQQAICSEWLGDFDGALKIYKLMADEYADSTMMDQVNFDLGRLSAQKGDKAKAKEYFDVVISKYPNSPYAESAKKRIFVLNAGTI